MIIKFCLLRHKPSMNNEAGSELLYFSIFICSKVHPNLSPPVRLLFLASMHQSSKPSFTLPSLIGMLSTGVERVLPDELYSSFKTQLKSKKFYDTFPSSGSSNIGVKNLFILGSS